MISQIVLCLRGYSKLPTFDFGFSIHKMGTLVTLLPRVIVSLKHLKDLKQHTTLNKCY